MRKQTSMFLDESTVLKLRMRRATHDLTLVAQVERALSLYDPVEALSDVLKALPRCPLCCSPGSLPEVCALCAVREAFTAPQSTEGRRG